VPRSWQKVEDLYHAALARPAEERDGFLQAACGTDAELRREVKSLLGCEEEARGLLEQPAASAATQKLAVVRGTRLGPYEVVELIGAGGMGEVYRARDARLGRDVAIKVLPGEIATDHDRLRRFQHEAHAVASLNHPHILTIHDVGSHEGLPYVVTELLEGENLRQVLGGRPPAMRQVLGWAVSIAQGLAAAHRKGIVHRDLKPENLFLTTDGRIKILDFGLAKLTAATDGETADAASATRPGLLMGTVAYMSPEQVQGRPADARSDVFSFGVVLYELLARKQPFRRQTASATAAAIVEETPASLASLDPAIPASVDWIVHRCLEKSPDDRFQSAHDVALALESPWAAESGPAAGPTERRAWQSWAVRGGLAAAAVVVMVAAFAAGHRLAGQPVPSYRQLTFRRGAVDKARFAPDGQTVVYSARWDGKPSDVFTTRLDLVEAQVLSLVSGAGLAAVHGGEVLISGDDGRLARVSLVGGTPREVADTFVDADWGPTGDIALVRWRAASPLPRYALEYPIGRTLVESDSEHPLGDVRVSPDGNRVAVVVGQFGARGGEVVVVDRAGRRTALTAGWMEIHGIAWSPGGQEVWFTAGGPARGGVTSWGMLKELRAVSLGRRERLLLRMAGDLTLQDVFRDGRVLVSHGRVRGEARGKLAGDEKERDLIYLDGTLPVGMSADGRSLLFQECAQAGGPRGTAYLRRVGDPSPIRLGEGTALALSPDGRRAVVAVGNLYQSGSRLVLLSAGAEPPQELPRGNLDAVGWAWWMPDGQSVLFQGQERNHPQRMFVQRVPDGQPQPFSPEGTWCSHPGDRWAACFHLGEDKGALVRAWELRSLDGHETLPAPWIGSSERLRAWDPDRRSAFLVAEGQLPLRVLRADVATGRRQPWFETSLPDPAGIDPIHTILTPDGRHYAYGYLRTLTDLFLVDGLR